MSALGAVVAFTIVWWLVFFMLLPLGARPSARTGPGHAASAPERPRLAAKALAATAAAALATGGLHVAALRDWIPFWNLLS